MVETLSAQPNVRTPAMSEAIADEELAKDRFDVPALVAKADHLFLSGDHRGAADDRQATSIVNSRRERIVDLYRTRYL